MTVKFLDKVPSNRQHHPQARHDNHKLQPNHPFDKPVSRMSESCDSMDHHSIPGESFPNEHAITSSPPRHPPNHNSSIDFRIVQVVNKLQETFNQEPNNVAERNNTISATEQTPATPNTTTPTPSQDTGQQTNKEGPRLLLDFAASEAFQNGEAIRFLLRLRLPSVVATDRPPRAAFIAYSTDVTAQFASILSENLHIQLSATLLAVQLCRVKSHLLFDVFFPACSAERRKEIEEMKRRDIFVLYAVGKGFKIMRRKDLDGVVEEQYSVIKAFEKEEGKEGVVFVDVTNSRFYSSGGAPKWIGGKVKTEQGGQKTD